MQELPCLDAGLGNSSLKSLNNATRFLGSQMIDTKLALMGCVGHLGYVHVKRNFN